MKVFREVRMKTEKFELGDRVKVKLPGETHFMTAIQRQKNGILFIFDDCLKAAHAFSENPDENTDYFNSDIRKYLKDVENMLPEKIFRKAVPNSDGDRLFLLTLEEVCGLDSDFNKASGQIPYFKTRKNRVADRNGDYEWWWTRTKVSAAAFANVNYYGDANCHNASRANGVRPAIVLSDIALA